MGNPSGGFTVAERLLAGLSQLLGWWGALPVVLINGGRSRFVSFQAVQSILFSLAVFLAQAAVVGCLIAMLMGGIASGTVADPVASGTGDPSEPGMILAALWVMGFGAAMPVLTGMSILSIVIRVFAMLVCFGGGVFRYPLLHRLAGRFPPK